MTKEKTEPNLIMMILLTNGQLLITELQEIAGADIGEKDCKLINPCLMNQSSCEIDGPWMKDYAPPGHNWFEIHSDQIMTMFKPRATLLEKYAEELIK